MSILNLFKPSTPNWRAAVCSRKGRRDENQDNYLLIQSRNGQNTASYLQNQQSKEQILEKWDARYARAAVLDGMGGHRHGREIAEQAVQELLRLPPQTDIKGLRAQIEAIHARLYQQFPGGDKRPGTTLVMADLDLRKKKGVIAHIGDSRAYLIRKNKMRQLTCDHHSIEFALRDGEIEATEYEQRLETGDLRLVQALGYGSFGILKEADGYKPYRLDSRIRLDLKADLRPGLQKHADVFPIQLAFNDVLMLGTDGLWRTAPNDVWRAPPGEIRIEPSDARKIADRAFQFGSTDNITVVLCGFGEKIS